VAVSALAPARVLREPRRIDWRQAVGAFIMVVATAGGITFWSATSDTRAVLVATRDLPAGARLTEADVAVARVRIDDAMYRAAVPAAEQPSFVGRQLNQPVYAHQLVARAQLSARSPLAPDQMVHTVPISAETAAGGRIRPGDSVRVFVTTDRGKPESRTTVVLARATVYDVGFDDRLGVVSTSSAAGGADAADSTSRGPRGRPAWISLSVTEEQALQLARARWNGELDIDLLPPEG